MYQETSDDFNLVVGQGKNWNILSSFLYLTFYRMLNDKLHIFRFMHAHFIVVIAGL